MFFHPNKISAWNWLFTMSEFNEKLGNKSILILLVGLYNCKKKCIIAQSFSSEVLCSRSSEGSALPGHSAAVITALAGSSVLLMSQRGRKKSILRAGSEALQVQCCSRTTCPCLAFWLPGGKSVGRRSPWAQGRACWTWHAHVQLLLKAAAACGGVLQKHCQSQQLAPGWSSGCGQ